jgi:hypothetical protein
MKRLLRRVQRNEAVEVRPHDNPEDVQPIYMPGMENYIHGEVPTTFTWVDVELREQARRMDAFALLCRRGIEDV